MQSKVSFTFGHKILQKYKMNANIYTRDTEELNIASHDMVVVKLENRNLLSKSAELASVSTIKFHW